MDDLGVESDSEFAAEQVFILFSIQIKSFIQISTENFAEQGWRKKPLIVTTDLTAARTRNAEKAAQYSGRAKKTQSGLLRPLCVFLVCTLPAIIALH